MWLWVQNNIGCHKFHDVKFFLRYHGLNHMSLVYAFVIKAIHVFPWVHMYFVCVCFALWVSKTALQLIIDYAIWEGFEVSHRLTFVKQPTRIEHMWRIITWHSTLATSCLLIYEKHMVHENNSPQPFKVLQRYYKMCITRKPTWMGRLTSYGRDKPLLHVIHVSHTKCQPQDMASYMNNSLPIIALGLEEVTIGILETTWD
jgi:hypothetical protein